MLAKIISLGTSKCVRIPKYLLDKYHLETAVEIDDTGKGLMLKPIKTTREGWAEAFQAKASDPGVQIDLPDSEWDDEDWTWE